MSEAGVERAKRDKIGVLMGGISAEREISLQTGAAVLDALRNRGWNATGIDVGLGFDPHRQIAEAGIRRAFLALHGGLGEDGCVQGLLECMGIPYTGSGVLASAIAIDKVTSKRLFDAAGLATPPWAYPATVESALELGLPVVLKPRREGSSVGLSVIEREKDLRRALAEAPGQAEPQQGSSGGSGCSGLLAEQYIAGRELSVALLGAGETTRVLGAVEIRSASGLYDYQAKYQRDDTEYLVPAPVPEPIAGRLSDLALAAHRLLECSGATRVDLRWTGQADETPLLLELNTLPGLTGNSLLPKIAVSAGISYGALVEALACDARLKAQEQAS